MPRSRRLQARSAKLPGSADSCRKASLIRPSGNCRRRVAISSPSQQAWTEQLQARAVAEFLLELALQAVEGAELDLVERAAQLDALAALAETQLPVEAGVRQQALEAAQVRAGHPDLVFHPEQARHLGLQQCVDPRPAFVLFRQFAVEPDPARLVRVAAEDLPIAEFLQDEIHALANVFHAPCFQSVVHAAAIEVAL